MLIPVAIASGIRDGTVTCAFRRWDAPRVKVGGTQITSAGVIRFEACDVVDHLDSLTDDDARAAGLADAAELRRRLEPTARGTGPRASRGGDTVYRITLSYVGPDPRLARRAAPTDAELAEVTAAVAALDAGRRGGPWTTAVLRWIDQHPGVLAAELADHLGRERLAVKADVRRLKALGLTISRRTGYELSPRGEAYLRSLEAGGA